MTAKDEQTVYKWNYKNIKIKLKLNEKDGKMKLAFYYTPISIGVNEQQQEMLKEIKVPKTWYISSDTMIQFMHYNGLEELLEQKYKPIDEIHKEYPHVHLLFKNSHFPPELVQGLSMALDDFRKKRPIRQSFRPS